VVRTAFSLLVVGLSLLGGSIGLFPAEAVSPRESTLQFTDISRQGGVRGLRQFGGHGIAWADVDADG